VNTKVDILKYHEQLEMLNVHVPKVLCHGLYVKFS
jgi:hypothetical protein